MSNKINLKKFFKHVEYSAYGLVTAMVVGLPLAVAGVGFPQISASKIIEVASENYTLFDHDASEYGITTVRRSAVRKANQSLPKDKQKSDSITDIVGGYRADMVCVAMLGEGWRATAYSTFESKADVAYSFRRPVDQYTRKIIDQKPVEVRLRFARGSTCFDKINCTNDALESVVSTAAGVASGADASSSASSSILSLSDGSKGSSSTRSVHSGR